MKFGTLEVTGQDGRRWEYPLDLPSLVVGRAEGNAIVIDDLSIARNHARLVFDSGRLMVEDLGSARGTYVDGHIIDPGVLNLVEAGQALRFGEVEARYAAPVPVAAGDSGAPELLTLPGSASEEAVETEGPLSVIRLQLTDPPAPIEPGRASSARLVIHNRGRVVDQVSVTVHDLPPEWVLLSVDSLRLMPGAREEVSIVIQPPRHPESLAGKFDYSVVVNSLDFEREAVAFGQVTILPFESAQLGLQPLRAKRDFTLTAQNDGNSVVNFGLSGADDEAELQYDFEVPAIDLQPGEERKVRFRVRRPKRGLFGRASVVPYKVLAIPAHGTSEPVSVDGLLAVHPPLEPLKKPALLVALLLIAGAAALAFVFLRNDEGVTRASDPEAAYAGVHMCDRKDGPPPQPGAQAASGTGAPLFAQNNTAWAKEEYAKAKDPEFGPDWCGVTIEQCGCAMTSVATVMALFNLLTMPDGAELTPRAVNEWFNKGATKTSKGWVSQGYVYGDVIWTSVNELSGEIARAKPGSPTIRFIRTGTGTEGEIRSELQAGRPIILEVPGHWIAAVGLDGDKILINDPYYADRRTLDVYKGKVKSSVLFEQSNDLSGFVVTVPKSQRLKITDKAGSVVGTLNTGTDQEVKESVQLSIDGAYYSTRDAWRDPTCVESPPKPGDGTTQIFLPGNRDDYKIEVLSPDGGATSVAFHRYDKNGRSAFETKDNTGPAVIAATFDPANVNAGGANVVPGVTPTTENGNTGGTGGAGTGGAAGGTATPGGGPTPSAPTSGPSGTATLAPTRTNVTPTPVPPASVTVACQVQYSAVPVKTAAISCTGTVAGTFTNSQWTVNGVTAPTAPGATTFGTSFAADTVVSIGMTACNLTMCTSGFQAVTVKFPAPGATGTPSNTPAPPPGSTPTPPPGSPPPVVTVVCTYVEGTSPVRVDCSTGFLEPFTSIAWFASNGSPTAVTNASKTFTTFRAGGSGQVKVTATVCYYSACTISNEAVVTPPDPPALVATTTTVIVLYFCFESVTFTANVSPSGATGTVTFTLNLNGPQTASGSLSGGTASATLQVALTEGAYSFTANYSGDSAFAASSYSGTVNSSGCGG